MKINRYLEISRELSFSQFTAATIVAINLLSTIFELLGLSMLMPVFQFMRSDGDIEGLVASSRLWEMLVDTYRFIGLEVTLPVLLITSFSCLLCRQVFIYVRQIFIAYSRENLVWRMRNEGFQRYLKADSAYHDRVLRGEIVNSLTTELRLAVETLFIPSAFVSSLILVCMYAATMAMVSPEMTATAIGVIAVGLVAVKNLFGRMKRYGKQLADANRNVSSFLVQRLGATRLIRLSGTEAAEINGMQQLTKLQRDSLVRKWRVMARLDVTMEPIIVGAGLVLVFVGATRFNLDIEEIGLFLLILLRLMPVSKTTVRTWQALLAGLASLTAFDDRLRAMAVAKETVSGIRPFKHIRQSIEFRDVRFDYGAGSTMPALRHINFTIPAGKMTALVGPSGSGKSTLIDLIPRLRECEKGEILIDGVPITEFDLKSLRAAFSYAPQQPQVFNVSAAQHIGYGERDPARKQIVAAAKLAGAHDFITALPEGYDSSVGEDGVHLSGGERQRLDLARSLFGGVPILILDEPTSNLDADAESAFRDALQRIRSETNITMIVVGHRLSTVAIADVVVVLDDGHIVETGTHNELLLQGGWYANAHAKQQAAPSFREEKLARG